MEITVILLQQICIMFLLISVGFYLNKKGTITMQGTSELGKILLNVVVPFVILKAFWVEFSYEKLKTLIICLTLSFLLLALSMIISHIFFKKDEIADFSCSFSNAGFIGIPLVSSTLGNEAVFYITCFIAELIVLQWTYGVFILSKSKKELSFQKTIKKPSLIFFFLGLALFFLKIPNPNIISSFLDTITCLNTPLGMIILGTYLAQGSLKELFIDKRVYFVSFIRLILIPFISILMLYFINVNIEIKIALLIVASAPVGSNISIFSQLYNKDYMYASRIVSLSTILSLISIPLMVSLAIFVLS